MAELSKAIQWIQEYPSWQLTGHVGSRNHQSGLYPARAYQTIFVRAGILGDFARAA